MSENPFVHLHVHTEFSLLDGLSRISKLVDRAAKLGMGALAITDHGTMFGVIDFYNACKKTGIKPIIGVEGYLARRGMQDRDSKLDSKPYHLLMLAKDETGYKNLLKIASEAQLRGYYYRPRIDRDFLAAHSQGLVVTSGCLAAQIPSMITEGREQEARELIDWYVQTFGRENFYLELQSHDIPELDVVNRWLIDIGKRDDVGFLATNDVHYVMESDYDIHDTLLCIQTSAVKAEPNRMRMTDNSYYLTSAEQMWQTFGHINDGEALLNSLKIAEMCDINLDRKDYHLPVFPVPDGFTAGTYLRHLCEKGLVWRYGANADDADLHQRLDHELNIIGTMGFDTYFLIVWDLCEFARAKDIWWNVRGSGAGSVAAYCLGITSIDPIQNNLLFERFLNPGRVSMPDIDMDFPDDRRAEMINYCARKYGEDKVAAIITFGTLGAKAAVRDVGRVLNVDLSLVNQAARLIPTEPKPKPVKKYVEDNPELQKMYDTMPEIRHIIDTAADLQGINRHASTHAAGVIVADKPLVEYIPLHRQTKGDENDEYTIKQVTQFPMETCESIGLLKIDFLGLSTLTYLRKACDLIKQYHGIEYTMENIPYRPSGDPERDRMLAEAFQMIGRGETIGVFQVESTGMQQMLREMRPTKFENIIAAVSLYRPGPMDYIPTYNARMHGREPVHYHHPKLETILGETYGIMVYQEQIMQVAGALFGYSLGDADLMRRAVSKKKKEDLLKHREIFIKQGPELDPTLTPEIAGQIFDDIEFFANYGFNKCLTGDAEIIDAETGRLHRIEDIAAGRVKLHAVLALDVYTGKLVSSPVSDVWNNGVKSVYRLTTSTGKSIEATANHPFYTHLGWQTLDRLCEGQEIAVVSTPPLTPPRIQGGEERYALEMASSDEARLDTLASQHHTQHVEVIEASDSDIYWDKIVSIEYVGEKPTYDLTVPETHNFVANDIIVHNSHAADYAVITVQTAFLKCHYPAEYMAALLTVYFDDPGKVATFLGECKRLNIPILPPHINYSQLDFSIEKQADGSTGVRFGMAAIKNASVGALQHIIDERNNGGIFADLKDFCQRVDLRAVGKKTMEHLIKVGAMAGMGTRSQLLAALDRLVSYSADHHKAKDVGQMGLFGDSVVVEDDLLKNLPHLDEVQRREMLDWEREFLGLYISSHPIDPIMDQLSGTNIASTIELKDEESDLNGKPVRFVGLIVGLRKLPTKNKEMMCVATLEDRFGTIDVVLFPRTWTKFEDTMQDGAVVVVTGKLDTSRGEPQIICEDVTTELKSVQGDRGYDDVPPPFPVWQPTPEPALEAEAVEVSGASNGNGHYQEPPGWDELPPFDPFFGEEAPPAPAPARLLTIRFHRMDDAERDQRRLKRVVNVTTTFSGRDHFQVVIVENDIETHIFDFKEQTTHVCDELLLRLGNIKGVETAVDLANS